MKRINIVITIGIVVAVGAVVCVVVLLLSKYDAPKKDNATSQLKPVVTEEQSGSELEKEASEMISSNPAAAAKKFQEAESAYRKSGSPEKGRLRLQRHLPVLRVNRRGDMGDSMFPRRYNLL
jgi:negative regulator of sigma E activity